MKSTFLRLNILGKLDPGQWGPNCWAPGPNCRLKLRIEILAELSNGPHSFLQETLASLNNMQSNLSHWMGLSWVGWKIDIFRCTHFIKLNVELILFEGDTETFDSLWELSMSNNSGMENIFHALASVHSHHLVMIAIHLNQRICVIELKRISQKYKNYALLCQLSPGCPHVKLIHKASKVTTDDWWSKRRRHATVVVVQSYPTCRFWACSIIRGSGRPTHLSPSTPLMVSPALQVRLAGSSITWSHP